MSVREQLFGILGLKGWALGRLRLKRLKTCHGQVLRAAGPPIDSLNGLKRLNGAGELPPEVDGPGGSPVDAGGREAGYSQLARVPYASMAPASAPDLQMRLQWRVFVPNNGSIGETGAEPSDACR